MNLLDSLLDAIVRLDGDALVMHVGEKPYVVTTSATMNEYRGPLAWGQVELSTRVLTTDAVLGMLGQILSPDQRQALDEYGAIEHEIRPSAGSLHRFTVVAARGGDDVWLEVRRRPVVAVAVAQAPSEEVVPEEIEQPAHAPTTIDAVSDIATGEDTEAPAFEVVHDEVQSAPTDADVDAMLADPAATVSAAPVAVVSASKPIEPEPVVAIQQDAEILSRQPVVVESDPVTAPKPVVVLEPEPAPVREIGVPFEPEPEPVAQTAPLHDVAIVGEPEPVVESVPQPAIRLVREPEPVVERVFPSAAAIEAIPDAMVERVQPPAAAIEQEPEPLVERIAASSIALEAEPPAVCEPASEAVVRVLEPEPVASPSIVIGSENTRPEEEPVAEPIAAIELEPPPVREREPAATAARVVIEPEPEPIRDVVVAFQPEPRPVPEGMPSIETVPEPIVVGREQPPVIAFEAETVRVQQMPVILEAESSVQPSAVIERDTAPVMEPAPIFLSEPPPVPEQHVSVQSQPQPAQEPAEPVAPAAAARAGSELIANELLAPVAHELVATRSPSPPMDAPPVVEPVASSPAAPSTAGSAPSGIEPEQTIESEPIGAAKHEEAIDSRPAIVLPLSRSPIKTDQAAEARPAAALPLDRVLRIAAARGAATVYVIAQSAPMIRVDGEISTLDGEPAWTSADIDRLVMDLAPARVRDGGQTSGEWVTDVPDVGRVRCVTFRDHRGRGVIFRMIPPRAISAEQLGLSAEIQALCSQSDGLVLVTGARASGKSTLLSAFVDVINRTRSDHVITIEPQIGFVHESRRSFVSQREVRGDSEQMASAVRSAFREDPDVLMIEDLRTHEIVALALEAAESGRLVFGSIPASSTVAAIDRLIELFPAERRAHAQTSLAGSLRAVISQVLLRKTRGGRVAAREVLLNTPAVAGLIMEGKTFQLPVALDSGRRQGMTPLADSLAALVREGTVQPSEAYRKAQDREALLTILRREGVDTSFVERLA